MMLHQGGRPEQSNDHPTLKKYIDGWLLYKEKRFKYEKYWFVLKGQLLGGGQLTSAFLFFFKDQNTHVKNHFVGSTHIAPTDTLELHKTEGNESRPWKCDFTIKLNGQKLHFRAQDNIERDRWIYALIDLVGQQLPPSDLPTLNNGIRPKTTRSGSSLHRLSRDMQESTMIAEHPPVNYRHHPPMPNTSTPGSVMLSTTATPPLSASNSNDYFTGRAVSTRQNQRAPQLSRGSANLTFDQNNSNGCATLNGRQVSEALNHRRRKTMPNNYKGPFTNQRSLLSMKSTTISLGSCTWYYGTMSRIEAEEALQSQPIGSFLLRDCQSQPGCYTLTFKDRSKTKNHMIIPTENNQFEFNGNEISKLYKSPEDGVLHYMEIKRNQDFHPTPFIMRSPGDGQEDGNCIQTDEKFDENTLHPKMASQIARSTSHPHIAVTEVSVQTNTPCQRKFSNIEMPTYLRRKSRKLSWMQSINDHYEDMQTSTSLTTSRGRSTSLSIKEDDDPDERYLIDSEINLENLDNKRRLSHPTGSYVCTSVQSTNEQNKSRRTSYNYPLPPTPEQPKYQNDFISEKACGETNSIYVEEQDDASYLDLNDEFEHEFEYNAPLPPLPQTDEAVDNTYEKSQILHGEAKEEIEDVYLAVKDKTLATETNGYIDMNAFTGYVTMGGTTNGDVIHSIQSRPLPTPEETLETDTNTLTQETENGYVLMEELPVALIKEKETEHDKSEIFEAKSMPPPIKTKDLSMNLAKRGSLVLPGAPKVHVKRRKGGSVCLTPKLTLTRQMTDPTVTSIANKDIMESQTLLRKLKLDPLPSYDPKELEARRKAPPLPPPRKERPQRLSAQMTIT